jgi:uncharacterized protein YdhG (YjbR/CyaY superfamily)
MPENSTPIDAYLAGVQPEQRAALQRLRELIHATVPEAEECISYGLPAFRLGSPIAGFGATANHCAYYPMSGGVIGELKDLLRGFPTSKGAVRFQPAAPLPDAVVRALLRARLREIGREDRAALIAE